MGIWPDYHRRLRYFATAIDVERASSRVLAVIGPIAGISDEHICALLTRATDCEPPTRLGLDPRPDRRIWDYCSWDWRKAVTHHPDLDTADLGQLVTQLHGRAGPRSPLEVLICGDYLVVDYSHALGDGTLGSVLVALMARTDEVGPDALARNIPKRAIWSALLRHFVLKPSNVWKVLELRKVGNHALRHTATTRIEDWESSRCGFTARMEPNTLAELRAWASQLYPGTSSASLTVALLAAALRSEGLDIDDEVTILVDCRRYLAPQHRGAQGNLAAGVPIQVPEGSTPAEVRRQMRDTINSRRPLARLAIAEVKAELASWRGDSRQPSSHHVDVPDRIRLTVSDLGRLRILEKVRWKDNAQPPSATAYVETDGPDAVDVEVTELLGAQILTASFCSKMISPSTIEAAFKRLSDDPFSVLQALNGI